MTTELEFFALCDSPYPWIPDDQQNKTIDIPGGLYDRNLGHRAVSGIGDTARLLERLGFDGGVVTEQHGGSVGLQSQAMIAATWMAANTTGLTIAAVGPLLNGYMTPVRLAEEAALLDNLSNGRLILGLPMGIGSQYHAYGVTNPSWCRDRYREAHDLLLAAFTREGPFHWQGDHFDVPYVNLWPKPLQEPRPEIWIPAAGSRESLGLAAKHGHTYMQVMVPRVLLKKNSDLFRQLCAEQGYVPDRKQIVWAGGVYVAETDAQARLEFEAAQMQVFQSLYLSFEDAFPPGHVSVPSFKALVEHGGYRTGEDNPELMTWERAIEEGWLVAGSPETVKRQLGELVEEMGAGRVMMETASMTPWMREKSLTLFAEQVMPAFRAPGAGPSWRRPGDRIRKTVSELPAAAGHPARSTRMVDLGPQGKIDVTLGHVPSARPVAID